jgi:AcrR family transcriptional regulator
MPSSAAAGAGERRTFIELARRAQVVAAAIKAIADLGYPAASLARISGYARTSKGVLTYHFASKEDLVRAVVDDVLARAGEYLRDRITSGVSARQMLRAYIVANLDFFGDFRDDIVAVLEIYSNARDGNGRPLYDLGLIDRSVAPLESLLRGGQAAGEFGEFDAHAMAIAIRGAIDAVPTRLARDPGFDVHHYGQVLARAFERATAPEQRQVPGGPS